VLRELVLAKLATHSGGEGLGQALLDQVMDTWEVREGAHVLRCLPKGSCCAAAALPLTWVLKAHVWKMAWKYAPFLFPLQLFCWLMPFPTASQFAC
jgi:hypothetical protein